MGATQSGPSYKPEVQKTAERYGINIEMMNSIYERYCKLENSRTDSIPEKTFLELFPFTTYVARENLKKFCYVNRRTQGCPLAGFTRLCVGLEPNVDNSKLANIIFNIFMTLEGELFDLDTFNTELQANLIFTCKDTKDTLMEFIKKTLNISHDDEIKTLTRQQFDELTKSANSYILLYGKQLIFGSYIFQ